MSTLGDFGVDTPEPAVGTATGNTHRCEAVVAETETDSVRRCKNDTNNSGSLCSAHERAKNVITISDDPYDIVTIPYVNTGDCQAIQGDDTRCTNSTRPYMPTCKVHSPAENFGLVDLEPTELDQELIHDALTAVSEKYNDILKRKENSG